MSKILKSCTVASPTECNYATNPQIHATANATVMQLYGSVSLKVLAARVLARQACNSECNSNETKQKMACNSRATNSSDKLHSKAHKSIKQTDLRNLILNLKSVHRGSENEWNEYADDVIHDWSHDLDEAISCFEQLNKANDLLLTSNTKEIYA